MCSLKAGLVEKLIMFSLVSLECVCASGVCNRKGTKEEYNKRQISCLVYGRERQTERERERGA